MQVANAELQDLWTYQSGMTLGSGNLKDDPARLEMDKFKVRACLYFLLHFKESSVCFHIGYEEYLPMACRILKFGIPAVAVIRVINPFSIFEINAKELQN